MKLNTITVKNLFRSKLMEVDGIRASNFASEGAVFTPPATEGPWFRETCGEWNFICSAEHCRRITGTITFEIYVRPGSGTRKTDLLCDRILNAFDPLSGPFGDSCVQIQPVSLRRTASSNDGSWSGSGIRIEFAAWEAEN